MATASVSLAETRTSIGRASGRPVLPVTVHRDCVNTSRDEGNRISSCDRSGMSRWASQELRVGSAGRKTMLGSIPRVRTSARTSWGSERGENIPVRANERPRTVARSCATRRAVCSHPLAVRSRSKSELIRLRAVGCRSEDVPNSPCRRRAAAICPMSWGSSARFWKRDVAFQLRAATKSPSLAGLSNISAEKE